MCVQSRVRSNLITDKPVVGNALRFLDNRRKLTRISARRKSLSGLVLGVRWLRALVAEPTWALGRASLSFVVAARGKFVLRPTVRNTCDVDVFQTQRVVLGTSETFVRGTRRYGPVGKLQARRPINLISLECDEVFRLMGLPRCKRVRVQSIARAMGQFLEEDGTVSQNCRPTRLNHSHGWQ